MKRQIKIVLIASTSILINNIVKIINSDNTLLLLRTTSDTRCFFNGNLKEEPGIVIIDYNFLKEKSYSLAAELYENLGIPTVIIAEKGCNITLNPLKGIIDGAFFDKNYNSELLSGFYKELLIKIKIASSQRKYIKVQNIPIGSTNSNNAIDKIIAIGASTGGVEAITSFINKIPQSCYGVLIVQHIPPNFSKMFAMRLNGICQIEVREAQDGDMITQGKALIAPGNKQMKVYKKDDKYFVRVYDGDRVNGHAPSVDVLFNSVAEVFKSNAMGIILTGMGADGARGLLNMKNSGAYTVGQNKESSTIYGMPKEAFDIGAVTKQVSLNQVIEEIKNYCK